MWSTEQLPSRHEILKQLPLICCVTSITDFITKTQSPSFWTRLHLVHYWNVLSEVGYDATEAYLLTAAKIKADQCQKVKKRCTLSGTVTTSVSMVRSAALQCGPGLLFCFHTSFWSVHQTSEPFSPPGKPTVLKIGSVSMKFEMAPLCRLVAAVSPSSSRVLSLYFLMALATPLTPSFFVCAWSFDLLWYQGPRPISREQLIASSLDQRLS